MFVMIDGPFSAANKNSDWDEFPTWFVGVCDDDGEPVDNGHTCFSADGAFDLGSKLAKVHNVELIDESSPV